jgi:hypothetical protein
VDTPYKLIRIDGQAALVQFQGKLRSIPASLLEEFSEDVFDAGVPYGVPWGDLLAICVNGETIEQELHKREIFTAADLMANPKGARGAVVTVVGDVYGALLEVAKRHKEV